MSQADGGDPESGTPRSVNLMIDQGSPVGNAHRTTDSDTARRSWVANIFTGGAARSAEDAEAALNRSGRSVTLPEYASSSFASSGNLSVPMVSAADQATFTRGESNPADGDSPSVQEHRSGRGARRRAVHHVHGPLDRAKALSMGGLRFAPLYTEEVRDEDGIKRKSRVWGFLSIFLQILTGIITGIAAYFVGTGIELLQETRLKVVIYLIKSGNWGGAWLAMFGFMVTYAAAASLPVIIWVRNAASSGIPTVIGLLNGIDLRSDFTIWTLLARVFGVTFAVGSGLAVGPEGPMIFVGACVGAMISRIPRSPRLWVYFGRPPSTMNDHVYLRDYVSTGAACGIAAAFRAPIAGVLFVVEEAASHFRREHLAKIFIGAVFAVLAAITLFQYKGLFEYSVTTGDFCEAWQWLSLPSLAFSVLVGIVCGVAGAFFNSVNLRVMRFRAVHANATMPLRRALDVLFLCFFTSIMWVALPYTTSDEIAGNPQIWKHGTRCIKDEFRYQLVKKAVLVNHHHQILYEPKACLYGLRYDPTNCSKVWELSRMGPTAKGSHYAKTCTLNSTAKPIYLDREDIESRCCDFDSIDQLKEGKFRMPENTSCPCVDFGEMFPSLLFGEKGHHNVWDNYTSDGMYNQMASLTLVPFATNAQSLFARGTPYLFSAKSLSLFLVAFFFLAAATAGSSIPSGLLLPMIVIGGCIGRLMTLGAMEIFSFLDWYRKGSCYWSMWTPEWQAFFHYDGGPLSSDVPGAMQAYLDPGIMAVVGAAAMLGGSSRISLMLTAMMVEITGDPSMIGPVGLATLVSVTVGNYFNHGLYHSLIDIQSLPFLPDRWPKQMPKALRIYHILDANQPTPVCLHLNMSYEDARAILEQHSYTGFPVTDASTGVVVGVALRHHLEEELDRRMPRRRTASRPSSPEASPGGPGGRRVDIGKVTDFHCITVRDSLPLEVAYNFFKRMELEHLIVVDDNTNCKAILTRSSLLPWRVEEECVMRGDAFSMVRPTIARPRVYRGLEGHSTLAATFPTDELHTVMDGANTH